MDMERALEVDQVPPPIETKSGSFVYYTKGSASGSQLYCRRAANGTEPEQVLIDTDDLSAQYGYELKSLLISDDHGCIGCLVTHIDGSHSGTETSNLMLFSLKDNGKVEHLQTLDNIFNFVFGENDTLFYTVLNDKLRAHKIRYHCIGHPQCNDIDIFVEEDDECFVDITRTKDKKFHIINSSTLDSSEVYVFSSSAIGTDTSDSVNAQLLRRRQRGVEYYADHYEGEFVILTNSPVNDDSDVSIGEPLPFRLMRAPSALPSSKNWKPLLCVADDERIEDVEVFRDYIMVSVKRQGRPVVIIHNRVSKSNSELPLPNGGNCVVRPDSNPQFDTSTVRLCFSSPVHLESTIEYNMATQTPHKSWTSTPLHINPDDYVIQHERASSDGLQVPVMLIRHKSISLASQPPTLMRVYGAYGVPLEPEFRVEDIPLFLRGWVIALAHVRGGGELGREWYAGGKGKNKSNSVTDLLSCAQFLLEKGWATPERLAITGVSAGGLVVGAALNRSPEYFRAAALHVPFVDPLSAMLSPDLPLTRVETAEWGAPATDPADYAKIRSYAPYDNIRRMGADRQMPSILVTAGGLDQRVSVWQPAKWVALLREQGGYADSATASKLLFLPTMNKGHFYSESGNTTGDYAGNGFANAHSLVNAFFITQVSKKA
ncbi:hypothetical protein GGH15_003916 [Coemansia sp. RSA 562]|nr:hypothetical protein GGH15_003916 [Coemansia sp. RSA 562]KAJ2284401.1 hypothetical protein GGH14_000113 [Coemansia sp. RSA 370]